MILDTAVRSTHLTQPIDSPGKTGEDLITNKVTATAPVSPDKSIDYAMHALPTATSKMIRSTLLLFFLLCLTTPAITHAESFTPRQRELIHILKHDCGSCHGITLKGGLGPALTPAALSGKSTEDMVHIITNGQPEKAMPPWGTLLDQDEIQWLAEQLKAGVAP
jgi:cytochrome c55X